MFFGKKDKDTRFTDEEYKNHVTGMSRKDRKDFERRQKGFKNDSEQDPIDAWLDLEDELDDMGW